MAERDAAFWAGKAMWLWWLGLGLVAFGLMLVAAVNQLGIVWLAAAISLATNVMTTYAIVWADSVAGRRFPVSMKGRGGDVYLSGTAFTIPLAIISFLLLIASPQWL